MKRFKVSLTRGTPISDWEEVVDADFYSLEGSWVVFKTEEKTKEGGTICPVVATFSSSLVISIQEILQTEKTFTLPSIDGTLALHVGTGGNIGKIYFSDSSGSLEPFEGFWWDDEEKVFKFKVKR